MQDIIFSRQQYFALITRLEEIWKKVSGFKVMAQTGHLYLDAHDVITMFPISLRTLERWRQKGLIPFYKTGNSIFYLAEDILAKAKYKGKHYIPQAKDLSSNEPQLSADLQPLSDKDLQERHRLMLLKIKLHQFPP